jgi:hypothetical protein
MGISKNKASRIKTSPLKKKKKSYDFKCHLSFFIKYDMIRRTKQQAEQLQPPKTSELSKHTKGPI